MGSSPAFVGLAINLGVLGLDLLIAEELSG